MGDLIQKQKAYYKLGNTKSYAFRMQALTKIEIWMKAHETDIMEALHQDLRKAPQESYFSEIGMIYSELKDAKKQLRKWMKPKKVRTPLAQFYSRSYIMSEPYGCVLIMSPWNYPFMLTVDPLIGAIAAGNCAMVKPSAYAPHTSHLLKQMIQDCFESSYIHLVEGGRESNAALLEEPFDLIFFTGSVEVGKLVLRKASEHVTPVILELGGKSPCIVDEQVNMKVAAKRIVFGKFLNSGQTCVAPDYIFVHRHVHDELVKALQLEIEEAFGKSPLTNDEYPKIINQRHFERLMKLMEGESNIIGGASNPKTLQIEPTIIPHASLESPCMQEEIFGPILPCIAYDSIEEVIQYLQDHDSPLALYLFSDHQTIIDKVMHEVSFGGGCINDTIIHLASSKLPFGGVGASGMGHYHGVYSFEAFSHQKSIVHKANWIDIPFRYHPYSKKKDNQIRKFLK